MAGKDDAVSRFIKAAEGSEVWNELQQFAKEEVLPRMAIASRLGIDPRAVRLSDFDAEYVKDCVSEYLEKATNDFAPRTMQ